MSMHLFVQKIVFYNPYKGRFAVLRIIYHTNNLLLLAQSLHHKYITKIPTRERKFYVRMSLKGTLKASVAFPLDDPHTLGKKTGETKKKTKPTK